MPAREMTVSEVVHDRNDALSPAERRVAQVVVRRPQDVAFGTVAELAEAAGTSGATVVRFAAKLGFDGFPDLQDAVREELTHRLRPATEKIRQRLPRDLLGRAATAEIDNVHDTLGSVDRDGFAATVDLLADEHRRVAVLSGDATLGVASVLVDGLAALRPGVELLTGGEVRIARALANHEEADVLLAIDFRRYERWVLRLAEQAAALGMAVVAITDSSLSPLSEKAAVSFRVAAEGVGPFDSHVGTLALCNVLVAGVAGRLRRRAADRLDRIEDAWHAIGALSER